MSECKTVTLRTRPLKKGMLSFYLDYYPGYRDQETMKTIRHEGLNIYIYANPKNQRECDFNAAMSEKACLLYTSPYGGFYTQEEVKDIIEYAAERYITVIPEIDLPGHITSALAAYPDLGCTGGPYEVATTYGVHKEVLCCLLYTSRCV